MAIYEENYFDMWQVIVNEVVGDVWLTLILGLILIILFSIKSKMPYEVIGLFSLIWMVVIYSNVGDSFLILWVFVVLMIGVMFYYGISKLLR